MTPDRFLLDTVFIQGLLNRHDQYHAQAKLFLPRLHHVVEVWVTEAVLVEVANGLSGFNRLGVARFIVMQEQNLTDAVTTDKHFVQAGYRLAL